MESSVLEEGEIPQKQRNQREPDLWALDLEQLESFVEKECQLKEKQLDIVRKSVEECTIKNKLQQQQLHSLETNIENRCKELRVKEKQLGSVEGKLHLICRDVEIKEKECEEFERRLEECRKEVGEKEEELMLIKSSICDHDRRLRLKQEDCSWQLEMLQKLTTERDEVGMKMKMEIDERRKEIDERRKEIEEKVARLSVIDDLIKDREIELNAFDTQFQQSVVSSEKLIWENEKLLRDQVAKKDEYRKEIQMKEEELGNLEKLIDAMEKKNDSMKAMRKKIIQLLREVESSKKDKELMKERMLELEKKEEEFEEVVKKLELSKADNELLKERNFEAENREKRLVEEMEHVDVVSKQCCKLLVECEIKEKQFKERLKEIELREKECDQQMKSFCSKEKLFKVGFKEFESKKREFDERTKKLVLKEKELEEQTRGLESKEKKHKEEIEELESKVILFEAQMREHDWEKDKFEEQMREHELKEKEYEVRMQELSSKEKKFEIQLKLLELKENEYEERLKDSASKEKQYDDQHSQASQALDNESIPTLDGENLKLVLNEQTNELESYVNTILNDLESTPDPAKLVLDVIQKPIFPLDQNEDKVAIIEERHIFLLEQLMKISPEIKYHVREEAMKLALDLKANINMGTNTENSLAVLGFLHVLSAYGLVSSFDKDEVFKHFELAAQHRESVELFRTLGFADKISDFIQNLINKQRIIEAVRFICAYKLAAKFRPVHILTQQMEKQIRDYKKFCKGMPNKQKVEVTEKAIGDLRNVLDCLLDNNIGSKNLVRDVRNRIHKLESQKEILARSPPAPKPIPKDEKVQQRQQQQHQQKQQPQQKQQYQKQKQPKRKKHCNETTNTYPPQDSNSNSTKRPKVATSPPPPPPPPSPPPPPPHPPIFYPQFQQRHVHTPWYGRENGMAPPRMMPGQFSYYSHAARPGGVGRHGDHAATGYYCRSGPYPPHI